MPFLLRVLFSGACAFVPQRDGKRMWVFLPDELEPYKVPATKDVPPHRAVVRFNLPNLFDRTGATIMQGKEARGLLFLNKYDLEILPGGAPARGKFKIACYDPDSGTYSPGGGSAPPKECFSWVAPVETACERRGYPNAGKINREFLRSRMDPRFAGRLAARVHLTAGTVYTSRQGDIEGRQIVWRFRPFNGVSGENDHRQILASEVALDLEIPHPYVELRATDFRGNPVDSVKLAPVAGGPMKSQPMVTVYVTNEESERILDVTPQPNIVPGEARVQDRVFEAFAKLSVTPPPREHMPIPVADYIIDYYRPGYGYVAAAAPPCSPARMEPV